MPLTRLFATAWLGALLAAAALAAPAAAQTANPPCGERSIGGVNRNGEVWHVFRISPRPGRACDMGMSVGSNAMIRQVRILKKPKRGRILSARPNRITYRAAATPGADEFAIALRVRNLRGEGWINVAVQVMPRR